MKGLHVDSLAVVVRTVKILDVTLSHLCLDTVVNLMRCFPCLEKLYMQVLILHCLLNCCFDLLMF
jgi:hypothetical protein